MKSLLKTRRAARNGRAFMRLGGARGFARRDARIFRASPAPLLHFAALDKPRAP